MNYEHKKVEKKWQDKWYKDDYFKTNLDTDKKKYYSLDMFPYPSGAGLHVGHPKGYTATDVISRYKRMQGYEVLHPIGWDSFGLPAEQHALKTGESPKIITKINTDNFRKQLKSLGISYDFNLEVNTSSPDYYKTTQWIFSKLHENGLTENREEIVNWCEELGTVLSNEEVLTDSDGKMISERGSFPVIKKPMKQWVLKITKYADKLIDGLGDLDWPDSVKNLQKNWIGKSEGYNIKFKTTSNKDLFVFTTMPEYFESIRFITLAPDKKDVLDYVTKDNLKEANKIIELTKSMTMIDRKKTNLSTDVVFTGSYAIHPTSNIKLPVFLGTFVLPNFGEESLLGVPLDDNRDSKIVEENSKIFDSTNKKSKLKLDNTSIDKLLKNEFINKKTNYKLKDWLFSRQRYWGEPFPIIHLENGEVFLDPNLPLELPHIDNYKPKNGKPPLINAPSEWLNVSINGKKGTRELNTMPQWAGSCWYYIGYLLRNNDEYIDITSDLAKKRIDKWLPVDLYIGGQEHAVLHLMYARFWMLFLYDIGVTSVKEPFYKLFNQGMILGPDGEKMSKSRGNTVSPDQIISEYGADTLRTYEMFMGSLEDSKAWSNDSVRSIKKWLDRVWRLFDDKKKIISKNNGELDSEFNKFIKSSSENLDNLKLNMVISDMMIFVNAAYKSETLYDKYLMKFLQVLSLYAPHMASELFELFDYKKRIDYENWPSYDEKHIKGNKISIIVQVNGKVRSKLEFDKVPSERELKKIVYKQENVIIFTSDKKIIKEIYVKGKIFNIVVK